MHYVYLIQSINNTHQTYIGYTQDLKTRLETHNSGGSPYTVEYKPWKLKTYLAFHTKEQALAFEHYLKSGSGRAFARRRLW